MYSVYSIFKCWSYTVLACGTLYVRVGTFDIQEEDVMLVRCVLTFFTEGWQCIQILLRTHFVVGIFHQGTFSLGKIL